MNMNASVASNNTVNADCSIPATSSISQPGKMKINPLQLLTALSILLNPKGGIKSIEEVKRVAGLMGKYSKKLVSKCIYLNILEATDSTLLDQFYTESGWDLVSTWITDAINTNNWPLTKQILNLLLVSPVTVERLKQNNSPKMVKELSKECKDLDIKTVAEQVVQNWKIVVVEGISGTANIKVNNDPDPQSTKNEMLEIVPVEEAISEITKTKQSPMIEDNNDYIVPTVESISESIPVKRNRGGKQGRGRGRTRGKARAEKVDVPSYADLLKQDLDSLSSQDTLINITIRNGSELLSKVSSNKKRDKMSHSQSIDSTDSEDNVPLSLIQKEAKSMIDLTGEDTDGEVLAGDIISIESSDSLTQSDSSSVSTEKTASKIIQSDKTARVSNSTSKIEKLENEDHKSKQNRGREHRRDKNRDRNKSKDSDRHRDKSRDKDKKSEHHSKDKDKSKDKRRDKLELSKSSSDKHHSRDKTKEEENNKPKDIPHDQTKLDQATLDKVKPLSIEGLAKIPRKSASFLDALSAADSQDSQEQKKPAIKTKSRAFRNTGLLDETINPPGTAAKRTVENAGPVSALKRHRPVELVLPDKRMKATVPLNPSIVDRPGGIKLISPKRPRIADDGGFMAALTAASSAAERKKITKKRRSSESEQKLELNKIPKLDQDDVRTEETPNVQEEEETLLSPTRIRPVLNFYKETLLDDNDEPKEEKVLSTKESSDDTEAEKSPSDNDTLKNVDNEEEESPEDDIEEKPALPAPAQEDYETIEVMHTSLTTHLKSVLVYHRDNTSKHKMKGVQWKSDENLTQTFLFPMDENERVNVNTLKFQDMMQRDRAFEKELLGKSRGRFGSPDLNPNPVDTCTEFFSWKLYPIHLPEESTVVHGHKSKDKHVQAQREYLTMELFFHPMMKPETPSEPDAEMVPRSEPISVPLKDITGSDSFSDNRNIPWPEPVVSVPEIPFMPQPLNPLPSHDGGHWIVGSHPTPRLGADMFNGPGACGPPSHQGGFPGQNFPNNMRGPCPPQGGWGPPPNDFGGPQMMLQNGPPHMGMPGPNMGGPPGMGPNMGGPPVMGPPGGPGMGMPGPPVISGRGGPRFKRGNWSNQPNCRPCKHFMNGHCRNGNNCRFAHAQPR